MLSYIGKRRDVRIGAAGLPCTLQTLYKQQKKAGLPLLPVRRGERRRAWHNTSPSVFPSGAYKHNEGGGNWEKKVLFFLI